MAKNEAEIVLQGLRQQPKKIPSSLLYDSKGSELYEQITRVPQYYLFNAELELFKSNALDIADSIIDGSLFVELGCGSALKTAILLNAIHAHRRSCTYVGIDISEAALREARTNLKCLVPEIKTDAMEFIHADFLDGLKQVKRRYQDDTLCIAWLGSTVGGFTMEENLEFFKNIIDAAGSHFQLLLSMDMWKNSEILYSAYHDKQGAGERFAKNGMRNALSCIGHEASEESVQSWIFEVQVNKLLKRVEMYLVFKQGLNLPHHHIQIRPGEKVLVVFSTKYSVEDIKYIASRACFQIYASWGDHSYYTCQMLLPASQALVQCWNDTDVLLGGLPDWNSKSIDLQHPYLFYFAHVYALAKMKILRRTDDDEDSEFDRMFSRGIDRNVMDPLECHRYPGIPCNWPSQKEVIRYVRKIREMINEEVGKGSVSTRMLCFVIEYERIHQETLAYMLAVDRKNTFQKRRTTTGCASTEHGNVISDLFAHEISTPEAIIEGGDVDLGVEWEMSDAFVWDNESPVFHTKVCESFQVAARAVSVKEFVCFMIHGGYTRTDLWKDEDFEFISKNSIVCPATWSVEDNEYYINTSHSTHHWTEVAEEAVYVNLAEAEAFSRWMECRIMREAEYQRILDLDPQGHVVRDLGGGGWEWTSTAFHPFPGFKPMPEYSEYSTNSFHGKHFVLKGWSHATHRSLRRPSFRNFYPRRHPLVFAKFRCCRSLC